MLNLGYRSIAADFTGSHFWFFFRSIFFLFRVYNVKSVTQMVCFSCMHREHTASGPTEQMKQRGEQKILSTMYKICFISSSFFLFSFICVHYGSSMCHISLSLSCATFVRFVVCVERANHASCEHIIGERSTKPTLLCFGS